MFEFSVNSMVRGCHVYQEVWEVCISEVLLCVREVGNRHDPYAIAVKKDELIVGHLSRKISCICSIFIRQNILHCNRFKEVFGGPGTRWDGNTMYLNIQDHR